MEGTRILRGDLEAGDTCTLSYNGVANFSGGYSILHISTVPHSSHVIDENPECQIQKTQHLLALLNNIFTFMNMKILK